MTILGDPRYDEDAAYERHQDLLIDMMEERRLDGQIEEYMEAVALERAGIIPPDEDDEPIPDDGFWEEAHAHEWEDT